MKDKRKREERKKKERKMGEMVGDQTANQAAKPLKRAKKKKNHQFWNSRIAGLNVFASLVSRPVCVCPFGMLGVLYWCPKWQHGGAVIWEAYRAGAGFTQGVGLWPGAARGVESLAEWSSCSADVCGGDLADHCSFIRWWHGEAFHDLSV
jgi:hypothetical protein